MERTNGRRTVPRTRVPAAVHHNLAAVAERTVPAEDVGARLEQLVAALGGRVVHDVSLPTGGGGAVRLDHVVVLTTGVFVVAEAPGPDPTERLAARLDTRAPVARLVVPSAQSDGVDAADGEAADGEAAAAVGELLSGFLLGVRPYGRPPVLAPEEVARLAVRLRLGLDEGDRPRPAAPGAMARGTAAPVVASSAGPPVDN